jgi:phytanoyl-CoA hydroxylase
MQKKISELVSDYDQKGWTIYKNLFLENEIFQVGKIIDNFLNKKINEDIKKTRSINFVNEGTKDIKNINSFHELAQCNEIKTLANGKKILELAKAFLKSEPEFRFCELFAKPPKIGLPSPDHQDNFYWGVRGSNALTIWVALDKATKDNGCLYYYDGSHKYGILNHTASYAKGSSQKIANIDFLKKFKISYPELNPGDALIHHSLVVHGSSKNISNNSRRGWTIQFKDKLAEYDNNHIQAYEKSLNSQIQSR